MHQLAERINQKTTVRSWPGSLGLVSAMVVGIILQFYGLDDKPLWGDELGSIVEARELGRNMQSIPYFALLRLWLFAGDSEAWLRSLSALFGVATIPVVYLWAEKWGGRRVALATTLLISTSSFKIAYGQEVRFYSLFLFSSALSLLALAHLAEYPCKVRALAWSGSAALCTASHVMGLVLVSLEALFLLGKYPRIPPRNDRIFGALKRSRRIRLFAALGAAALLAVPILLPQGRELAFNALAQYMNADSRYSVPRGLSLVNLAKIPFTLFAFVFGQYVYPLDYPLVLPGCLLSAALFARGLRSLRQRGGVFGFTVFTLAVAPAALYLVFDPIAPPSLQGAAPRYLIFLLPLFYLVIAHGGRGRVGIAMVSGLLLVNGVSISCLYSGNWSYERDSVDWRDAGQFVRRWADGNSLLLLDGRAGAAAGRYLAADLPTRSVWQYDPTGEMDSAVGFDRIILASDDYREPARWQANLLLARVSESHDEVAAWVQYPLFIYVLERKPSPARIQQPTSTQPQVPKEIYGLEFQDLRLPLSVQVDGARYRLTGAFSLSKDRPERTITLDPPARADGFVLLGNLVGVTRPRGETVAVIAVEATDGSRREFPLRRGAEIEDWRGECQPSSSPAGNAEEVCRKAYSWTKRVAIAGSRGYPGAWEQFDAAIFSAHLWFDETIEIKTIAFRQIGSDGAVYVWGLGVAPPWEAGNR